ncbi:pilus assembly protein PilM [Blastopirellula retiformator]|uniref:Competence protein A n=1 Tax=Blastopirellula retiformator TaxID=2527970 RepID=A0A5C5VJQ4_9BACT|nr:pilus assembly protein PilM [Blastopirellula retiformator]TWT38846.1 Competence protein A [Blastopirellula retiformator]
MNTTQKKVDPYKVILRIDEEHRPLNAYQILRLDLYEDDTAYIQICGDRTRKNLQQFFGKIDPPLWRQVYNEVEDAIETLTDRQKKEAYDIELKRNSAVSVSSHANGNGHAHAGHAPPLTPEAIGDKILCPTCTTLNPPNRKFCGDCGNALYIACAKCGCMNTVHEKFCGGCGVNLAETAQKQQSHLEKKFEEAEQLVAEGKHDAACAMLREMTRPTHEGEMKFAQRAALRIEQIIQEKEALLARALTVAEEANELYANNQAEKAVALVRQIPQLLWHDELTKIHDKANNVRREIKRLSKEIKLAVAEKRTSRLLPKVERLLELKPHDVSAQRLAERLKKHQQQADVSKRDKLLAKAKEYVSEYRYERAYEVLTEVPEGVRSENFHKYFDQVAELAWIANDIKRSTQVDRPLIGLASRLVKLMPRDRHAIESLHKMSQKFENRSLRKMERDLNWAEPPKRTTLGSPVALHAGLRQIKSEKLDDNSHFQENRASFFVAIGLALQGLGVTQIDFNLAPAKAGMLGKLAVGGKKIAGDRAWGIDLSNSGLKAVLLTKKKIGEKEKAKVVVVTEDCFHCDHKRPLSRADDADRRGLVQESVEKLLAHLGEGGFKDAIVALGQPASELIGRFLKLPPVDPKKLEKTIHYEARNQIPFPLEELSTGYHVWDAPPKDEDVPEEPSREVAFIATRLLQLQERLAFLKRLGITPHIVQADPIALHNYFHFDVYSDAEKEMSMRETDQTVGILDVGSDASTLVVSGLNSLWFRSLEVGGDSFTRILVRQMSLTFTKAEELKRQPDTATEVSKMYEVMDTVFKNLTKEASVSISNYTNSNSDRPISEVNLVGGGGQLHSLVRLLQYGRQFD